MGTVIRFPDDRRTVSHPVAASLGPSSVVILPVVRVERHGDGAYAPDARTPGGSRRR